MYDIILKNGLICDGAKNPAFRGDIAIKDGLIAQVGAPVEGSAAQVVDLGGLVVSPGFIDIHSHSDTTFLIDERCESKLYQGVTAELSGQCGHTIYPCPEGNGENLKAYVGEDRRYDRMFFASFSLGEFLQKLAQKDIKMGVNQLPLIGHGMLRCGVMGFEGRAATDAELAEMQALLDRDMQTGAWGLSFGLGYTPGVFSDQRELNAMGEVTVRYGGIITSHMRDQGLGTPASLEEMFEINRATGAHVHIVHFKASGKPAWGMGPAFVGLFEQAKRDGVHVTADVYPYNASSSGITNVFPKWSLAGGTRAAAARLLGPERERILDFLREAYATEEDGKRLLIVSTRGVFPEVDGKTVDQIAAMLGLPQAEAIAEVAIRTNGQTDTISFAMDEQDVLAFLKSDTCVSSDGSALPFDQALNEGRPHPRNFGTFPRFLKMARELALYPMEEAVHRITGKPAAVLGIKKRGVIKEGNAADLTVFDWERIADRADFQNPFQKPEGVRHVIMNGRFALKDGVQTGERLGRMLLKTDKI